MAFMHVLLENVLHVLLRLFIMLARGHWSQAHLSLSISKVTNLKPSIVQDPYCIVQQIYSLTRHVI